MGLKNKNKTKTKKQKCARCLFLVRELTVILPGEQEATFMTNYYLLGPLPYSTLFIALTSTLQRHL